MLSDLDLIAGCSDDRPRLLRSRVWKSGKPFDATPLLLGGADHVAASRAGVCGRTKARARGGIKALDRLLGGYPGGWVSSRPDDAQVGPSYLGRIGSTKSASMPERETPHFTPDHHGPGGLETDCTNAAIPSNKALRVEAASAGASMTTLPSPSRRIWSWEKSWRTSPIAGVGIGLAWSCSRGGAPVPGGAPWGGAGPVSMRPLSEGALTRSVDSSATLRSCSKGSAASTSRSVSSGSSGSAPSVPGAGTEIERVEGS